MVVVGNQRTSPPTPLGLWLRGCKHGGFISTASKGCLRVGGSPVGEYWPVCMPPCVQFPALEKYKILIKKGVERDQLYHQGLAYA